MHETCFRTKLVTFAKMKGKKIHIFVQLGFNLRNGVTDTLESRAQCYKTVFVRDLWIFEVS